MWLSAKSRKITSCFYCQDQAVPDSLKTKLLIYQILPRLSGQFGPFSRKVSDGIWDYGFRYHTLKRKDELRWKKGKKWHYCRSLLSGFCGGQIPIIMALFWWCYLTLVDPRSLEPLIGSSSMMVFLPNDDRGAGSRATQATKQLTSKSSFVVMLAAVLGGPKVCEPISMRWWLGQA